MKSVREAANALGLSPARVRQLIGSGHLYADRVGGRWLVPDAELDNPRNRAGHRPWNPEAAWGLIWLAIGRDAPWLSPKQAERARHRLSEGVEAHVDMLRSRAARHGLRGHPSALRRLRAEERLVRSGISAVGDYEIDIVGGDDVFEGYIAASDLDAVVADHALVADRGRPNVWLHVVHGPWPFEAEVVAPALVVGLDLIEHDDQRLQRSGRALVKAAGKLRKR